MTSGLYVIKNIVSTKMYVGMSVNIEGRISKHKSLLARGMHVNRHMQQSWNKHGAEAFVFEKLIVCHPSRCSIYEDIMLKSGMFEFNIIKISKAPPLSDPAIRARHLAATTSREFRQKRSADMKSRLNTEAGIRQLEYARSCIDTVAANSASSNLHKRLAETPKRREHLLAQASAGGRASADLRRKEIMCVETGEVFKSIRDAARHMVASGVTSNKRCWANIQRSASGFKPHAYGFHWRFL